MRVSRTWVKAQCAKQGVRLARTHATSRICLARAIVTAVANINKHKWTASQLKHGLSDSRKLQRHEAIKPHEEAGVEMNQHGSTLEDIAKFADHLKVHTNIIDGDQFNELIFTSENERHNGSGQHIYLYKNKDHFDVITSMQGFWRKNITATHARKLTHIATYTNVRQSASHVSSTFQTAKSAPVKR